MLCRPGKMTVNYRISNMTTLPCILQTRQPENVLPIALALLPFSPELPEITEPPFANRGLNPQSPTSELIPTIDYLTLLLVDRPFEDIDHMRTELEAGAKISFVDKPGVGTKHGTYYQNHMASPLGGRIAYRLNKTHPENWDAIFVVPGKLCGRMGSSRAAAWNREGHELGGHLSRIDINVDDHIRDLNYEEVLDHIQKEQYTTFQGADVHTNYKKGAGRVGNTLGFGKRSGEKYVRIYDALPVHGIDATRFEGEFKGDYAKAIGKAITKCTDDESLSRLLGGLLNGIFRITDKKDKHNANRVASAPFWERFSNRLDNAKKLSRERVTVCLQDKFAWLRDKCSKALAMFRAYCGVHYEGELNAMVKAGFARLNADDLAMLKTSSKEGLTRIWCDNNMVIDLPHNPEWFREWMNQDVLESEGYDAPF